VNPFPTPGRPLCPWETTDHAGRFADVDHSAEAFAEFQAAMRNDDELTRRGQVFLAVGGSGCGKTSLMHRCAHWLQEQSVDPRVVIVDLTQDDRKGADIEQRLRHVFARLIDELEVEGLFSEQQLASLRERREDPFQACPVVSKCLVGEKVIAAVLLPPSDLSDEVSRYAQLVRKNLLFVAETSFDHVAEACAHRLGPTSSTPVRQLRVGKLSVEDGWRYAHHHLALSEAAGLPTLSEQTMRAVVEARITGTTGGMTVKELQTLLHGIYGEAGDAARPALEFRDFAAYYMRTARLI